MRRATRDGSTKLRPPGLILGVAVRSHRSRPLALFAQLASNASPGEEYGRPEVPAPAPPTSNASPGEESGQAASLGSSTPTSNASPGEESGQAASLGSSTPTSNASPRR